MSKKTSFLCCTVKPGGAIEPVLRRMRSEGGTAAAESSGANQLRADLESVNLERHSEDGSIRRAKSFSFAELAKATSNFSSKSCLGVGGFGSVYKGTLGATKQVVAIKRLNVHGEQGIKEFAVEMVTLGKADHPNLTKLIGFCCHNKERLLVYEFMPLGDLSSHLHELSPDKQPLGWNTRLRIITQVASGLEYLHCQMDPPVIHRDIKATNILLDHSYNAKLADFGIAKEGPSGHSTLVGTFLYVDPIYRATRVVTLKSDIYSFGVLLLEIITGRKPDDKTKPVGDEDKYMLAWVFPRLEKGKNLAQIVDPLMPGMIPSEELLNAIDIAQDCMNMEREARPSASELVLRLVDIGAPREKKEKTERPPAGASGSTSASAPGNTSARFWELFNDDWEMHLETEKDADDADDAADASGQGTDKMKIESDRGKGKMHLE